MSDEIRGRLSRHEPLVAQALSTPGYVALKVEELRELWELAHEAVHPQEQEETDNTNLRMHALQLAHQMEISRLHALDNPPVTDTVMLAESYYTFLTAKDEIDGP